MAIVLCTGIRVSQDIKTVPFKVGLTLAAARRLDKGRIFALSAGQHRDELNANNMKKGEISFTSMPSAAINHSLTLPTQFFFTLSNSSFLLADSTILQPHFTSS